MSLSRRRLNWFFCRAWPVPGLLGVALMHAGLVFLLGVNGAAKLMIVVCQFVGVIVLVISIDSNLAAIRGTTIGKELREQVRKWWSEWPSRSVDLAIHNAHHLHLTLTPPLGSAFGDKSGESVEDRLQFLEKAVLSVRTEMAKQHHELTKHVDNEVSLIEEKMNGLSNEINEVDAKYRVVTVGGLRGQFFAICLILYSAILSYLA